MNQRSSSTSSSEARSSRKRALLTLVWTLVGLALIDVAVNLLFAFPDDPKATGASRMQLYFDYGRSTEGKLARVTRPDRDETAPITLAGWYEPLIVTRPGVGTKRETVTFYGMSHSVRLAEALERTSRIYSARSIGAPGATANWAYGAFLRDKDKSQSRAAVLSIMSLNTPMIATMSAMSWNAAFPLPYTADRFVVTPAGLGVVRPPYDSFESYVDAFYDPAKWEHLRGEFERYDNMYDRFLMESSILDGSSTARLVRRAYAGRAERRARARVLGSQGFDPESEEIRLANAIVADFAERARREGVMPVVFIINNLGFSDHLYQALRPTLERYTIPHISSHSLVSPSDPRGYLPDTHFTDANDDRFARALERLIEQGDSVTGRAGLQSRRN